MSALNNASKQIITSLKDQLKEQQNVIAGLEDQLSALHPNKESKASDNLTLQSNMNSHTKEIPRDTTLLEEKKPTPKKMEEKQTTKKTKKKPITKKKKPPPKQD